MTTDQLRERFEKWAFAKGYDMQQHTNGEYCNLFTSLAWEAAQFGFQEGAKK